MSTPPCVLLAMASARKLFYVGALSCFILGFVGCSMQSNNVVVSKAATEPTALTNSSKIGDSESTDSPTKSSQQGVTFYSVDHYDASRNPATDLSDTIRRATKERKRILIQVGGDWCSPCRLMSALMETNGVIRDTVTDSFVVMKVAVTDEQGNEAFLSQYPRIDAYPHILVLDSDGRFLHSQGTFQWDDEPGPDELDARKGYNQESFRQFLVAWQPEPAETVADSETDPTAQPPQTPDKTGPSTAVADALKDSNKDVFQIVINDMPGFRDMPVTFSFARKNALLAERIFANGELVRAAVHDELRYFQKTEGKVAGDISELSDIKIVNRTVPSDPATSWYLHCRTKDGIELKQDGFGIRFEDLDHWDLEIPAFLHPKF